MSLIGPVSPGPPTPKWMPEACRTERDHGPWEYRFYDRAGRLLDRVRTLVGRPATQACLDALDELEQRRRGQRLDRSGAMT